MIWNSVHAAGTSFVRSLGAKTSCSALPHLPITQFAYFEVGSLLLIRSEALSKTGKVLFFKFMIAGLQNRTCMSYLLEIVVLSWQHIHPGAPP